MGKAFQKGAQVSKPKITPAEKQQAAEKKRAKKDALQILRSPRFFYQYLKALKKVGLVGEKANALVVLIVLVSRILRRPLNLFVRGKSSSGKNWLISRALRLMPKSAIVEVTSASDKAWNYSDRNFQHRVVYLQERNQAAGTIDPIRLLISEGKLVRIVPKFRGGRMVTTKVVARGPVAAISTTTKNRLKIDDETRHISIWIDETSGQTRKIVSSYTSHKELLSRRELRAWCEVHRQLETRLGSKISFPDWFEKIPERLFVNDLRVRRYYPAFVEACRVVCLIRSFQSDRNTNRRQLAVDFADFAITTLIFEPVFVDSLRLGQAMGEDIRKIVEEIATRKGRPVRAKDIAHRLEISMDRAYAQLRQGKSLGVIQRVNEPEKDNRMEYEAVPLPRFIPEPEKLFQELEELGSEVRFVHPVTGKSVVYRRKKEKR